MGYSPWGCKESDTTERLHFFQKSRGRGSWSKNMGMPGPQILWLEASTIQQKEKVNHRCEKKHVKLMLITNLI